MECDTTLNHRQRLAAQETQSDSLKHVKGNFGNIVQIISSQFSH
jgi:hypothetical protein